MMNKEYKDKVTLTGFGEEWDSREDILSISDYQCKIIRLETESGDLVCDNLNGLNVYFSMDKIYISRNIEGLHF